MAPRATDEETALKHARELNAVAETGKPIQGIIEALTRIKNEVAWTIELSESMAGVTLNTAVRLCKNTPEQLENDTIRKLVDAFFEEKKRQLSNLDLSEVSALRWQTVPVQGVDRITIEFRDCTSGNLSYPVKEVWPPETVECVMSEPFENAAQRFRVQANKKHRHPFHPSQYFEAMLNDERTTLKKLGSRTVADILASLPEERVVQYVRDDKQNSSEWRLHPARDLKIWDRVLPSWCATPDHWIEPVPPPGYVEHRAAPPAPQEQYYKKVPTLHLTGTGRHIVPSARKPEIIARAVFIPVQDYPQRSETRAVYLKHDADVVPHGTQLTPGKMSLDDARALLGRVVQSSEGARSDPDPDRAGKRRKMNKVPVPHYIGIAWGIELEEGGTPGWLHCAPYVGGGGIGQYVIDLTGQQRSTYEEPSPLSLNVVKCAWVGAVVLAMDLEAMRVRPKAEPTRNEEEQPSFRETLAVADEGYRTYDAWHARTKKWIRVLNTKRFAPLVTVGADGTFVGGDLELAKGDGDEFEAEVTGAKAGIWLMSVEPTDVETVTEDAMEDKSKTIRFVWTGEGSVNYDALPRASTIGDNTIRTDESVEWEIVGSFSVDSSLICMFSKHALDQHLATGPEDDRQGMLEAFIPDDGEVANGTNFVPGGLVVYGNDGGFEIEGRRDADGCIVELRVRL